VNRRAPPTVGGIMSARDNAAPRHAAPRRAAPRHAAQRCADADSCVSDGQYTG